MKFNEYQYQPSRWPQANTDEGFPAYIVWSAIGRRAFHDIVKHSHTDEGQLDMLSLSITECYPCYDPDLYPHCSQN